MGGNMNFFVGRHPLDAAPVANGKILVYIEQYCQRDFGEKGAVLTGEEQSMKEECSVLRKPHDWIQRIFYPYHDRHSNLLGKRGIYTIAYDAKDKFGYDFHNEVGYIAIDGSRYIDATGIYEVTSHKGYQAVRTTTWVPRDVNVDSVVRKIEVSSSRNDERLIEVYPCLHSKAEWYERDGVILSKITNYADFHMAVKCVGAEKWSFGLLHRNKANAATGQEDKTHVAFHAVAHVKSRQWSKPIYLVIGLGATENEAIDNLKRTINDKSYLYEQTYSFWRKWLDKGASIRSSNPRLNYVYDVAKLMLKMSFQWDGLTTYIGYWWYQGGVWIRDNCWIATGLALSGYFDEALEILNALKTIIKKRKDGGFYYLYDARTREVADFSFESDSMGLILTAAGYYHDYSGDAEGLKPLWEMLEDSADWICEHIDDTGTVAPDAGIWEEWSEEKGQKKEHMVWTSAMSSYGLRKASEIAQHMGKTDKAERYMSVSEALRENVWKRSVRDGILRRSPESVGTGMDSSVLYFFTWAHVFDSSDPVFLNTLHAIEDVLGDRWLGGIWRHDNSNNDLGDTQPWPSSSLWVAECYLLLGDVEKAWKYINWVLDHTSNCGMIPECMFTQDICQGTGMTSLSSIGIIGAMLRHRDPGTGEVQLPGQLSFMEFRNVPAPCQSLSPTGRGLR
jgi:GH15 family glucan-1,4-alpha-glucosidase